MLFALPLVPLSLFLVVHLLLNFDSSLFYSLGFFFNIFSRFCWRNAPSTFCIAESMRRWISSAAAEFLRGGVVLVEGLAEGVIAEG